tara:strand:- start:152 stop:865 length:714 start_codon:yes stop_codon:yes gene_type:complete
MNFENILSIPQEIICLSLSESKDRRKIFEDKWGKLLEGKNFRYHISERATFDIIDRKLKNFSGSFLQPNTTPENIARLGCWFSHYEILSNARSRNVKSVLVLEDDTFPNLQHLEDRISDPPPDWDILYLGSSGIDVLANFSDKSFITETTFRDSKSRYNYKDWKKVRAWGTYSMIVKDTVFDKYIKELKDYAIPNTEVQEFPTADGTFYFYLWKFFSFYFSKHFVTHDDSQISTIKI